MPNNHIDPLLCLRNNILSFTLPGLDRILIIELFANPVDRLTNLSDSVQRRPSEPEPDRCSARLETSQKYHIDSNSPFCFESNVSVLSPMALR